MKIFIKKSISCLLAVILISLPPDFSVKAADYLNKSVFETGENHFVYLCPEDTNDIIIHWPSEVFAALNFQGKWALYDFYGTQLTDYIYDGFYNISYADLGNAYGRLAVGHIPNEIKCYIGNETKYLPRSEYIEKYADYPDSEDILSDISTGVYKGQDILLISDFPPNDERLLFRLAMPSSEHRKTE